MTNAYTKAGVDVEKAENALSAVKDLILSTYNKAVVSPENGFAAMYEIAGDQVLASATDGVGTKLDIAVELKKHSTIGQDLVAMVVNDLAVYGITPLFFLDYMATSKIDTDIFVEIVKGIVDGCKLAGCALIGGETAEMPGFYPDDKYDLAGFAVGIANKKDLILGDKIKDGDVVVGLASSGLHSNGFSLARKIIKDGNLDLSDKISEQTLGEALLEPTVIYTKTIKKLMNSVKLSGLAHITGGGFKNISRILPDNVDVKITKNSWDIPYIFNFLKEKGDVTEAEMFDIFNMGIGMTIIVDSDNLQKLIDVAKDNSIKNFIIGEVVQGKKEVKVK